MRCSQLSSSSSSLRPARAVATASIEGSAAGVVELSSGRRAWGNHQAERGGHGSRQASGVDHSGQRNDNDLHFPSVGTPIGTAIGDVRQHLE